MWHPICYKAIYLESALQVVAPLWIKVPRGSCQSGSQAIMLNPDHSTVRTNSHLRSDVETREAFEVGYPQRREALVVMYMEPIDADI